MRPSSGGSRTAPTGNTAPHRGLLGRPSGQGGRAQTPSGRNRRRTRRPPALHPRPRLPRGIVGAHCDAPGSRPIRCRGASRSAPTTEPRVIVDEQVGHTYCPRSAAFPDRKHFIKKPSVVSGQLSVVSGQPSAVSQSKIQNLKSRQQSAIGRQWSVVSCQWSVVSHQGSVNPKSKI